MTSQRTVIDSLATRVLKCYRLLQGMSEEDGLDGDSVEGLVLLE